MIHSSSSHVGSGAYSTSVTSSRDETDIEMAAARARSAGLNPAHMLRVAALLAAPVFDSGRSNSPLASFRSVLGKIRGLSGIDPRRLDRSPAPRDLHAEWERMIRAVRETGAPIFLTSLVPPTLATLRRELSSRVADQGLFPHVLHISGHILAEGLILEDEYGQAHAVTAASLPQAIRLPQPIDLVMLDAGESVAEAQATAQALIGAGLARAVVSCQSQARDDKTTDIVRTLYASLAGGVLLREAVARAQQSVPHTVTLLGDGDLRFSGLAQGATISFVRWPPYLPAPEKGIGFVGRRAELMTIARCLAQPPGVIVISGPPGIGKSRLALEAAYRNAWRFPGGTVYVAAPRSTASSVQFVSRNLSTGRIEHTTTFLLGMATEHAAYVLNRLAERLRLPNVSATGQVSTALLEYAYYRPTLFVLDNLETLPPSELDTIIGFLRALGGRSAAIIAIRSASNALNILPRSLQLSLNDGLGKEDAVRLAYVFADRNGVSLTPQEAAEIARATAGHPLLIRQIVACADRRDRKALLAKVRARSRDFAAQVKAVYDWSEEHIGEAGTRIWSALPLFPAGWAPEAALHALDGAGGADALRTAAVVDFDPLRRVWRWHPTAAEYAAQRWLLEKDERMQRYHALLPVWCEWLARLERDEQKRVHLEDALPNLAPLIREASSADGGWAFLQQFSRVLPAPDSSIPSLRAIQESLYEEMSSLAPDAAERAQALYTLSVVRRTLGRLMEALLSLRKAVALYRELAAAQPDAFRSKLAAALEEMGLIQSRIKMYAEGLASLQEAVALYRELAAAQPEAFRPDLGRSLGNLGVMLLRMRQHAEALASLQETVALYRELTAAQSGAFRVMLAINLQNLGLALALAGRYTEALASSQEAVRLYRESPAVQPENFWMELISNLVQLFWILKSAGQYAAALASIQKAIAYCREMEATHPQVFRPVLAHCLESLGSMLLTADDAGDGSAGHGLGDLVSTEQQREILTVIEEAVAIRRELVAMQAGAFRPMLAQSLVMLAVVQATMEQWEEALATTEEAVALIRDLAAAQSEAVSPELVNSLVQLGRSLAGGPRRKAPATFHPRLARSVAELGYQLTALQPTAAQEVLSQAVALYRELAAAQPETFRPDLASCLVNLGGMLKIAGQHEEALAAAQEAVALYRELAAQSRAFRQGLARSLFTLVTVLKGMDQKETALAAAQEAVALYRELAARSRAFLPELALSLHRLGTEQFEAKQYTAAVAPLREAVAIYRNFSHMFASDLALSLMQLGTALVASRRSAEAVASLREAAAICRQLCAVAPQAIRAPWVLMIVEASTLLMSDNQTAEGMALLLEAGALYRELPAEQQQAIRPRLAHTLWELAAELFEAQQYREALAIMREAAALYRELAAEQPQEFRSDLARILTNLGRQLAYTNQCEEALAILQEAAALYRELATTQPQAFRGELANNLSYLGSVLAMMNRLAEGLAIMQEAIALYRELEAADPEEARMGLVRALSNLGEILSVMNRHAEALAPLQEAIALCREVIAVQPHFLGYLAVYLNCLGRCFAAVGRIDEALNAHEEALHTILSCHEEQSEVSSEKQRIVNDYVAACQACGRAPDARLLSR